MAIRVGLAGYGFGGQSFHAPLIASAKASSAAGFMAVSRAAAIASGGAPASPLLTCSETRQWRDAAKSASQSAGRRSSSSSAAGSQADP